MKSIFKKQIIKSALFDRNGGVVECENIEKELPDDTVFVIFSNQGENSRLITIECNLDKTFLKEL